MTLDSDGEPIVKPKQKKKKEPKKIPPPKPTNIPKSDKQVITCTALETYDEDANMISLANYVQDGNAVALKEQKENPFEKVPLSHTC